MRLKTLFVSAIFAMAVAGCGGTTGTAGTPTPGASSTLGQAAELPGLTRQGSVTGFRGAVAAIATNDAVWVLDHSAATLVRIDPATNAITATVVLGSGNANGLGLAGGRLWTFHQSAGTVLGIDPAAAKIVETVEIGQDGDWFFVGDEAAWLITGGKLARIDGATAAVTSHPLDASCGVSGVAAGGGFVWIVDENGGLCKINEDTGAVVTRADTGAAGSAIAIVDGAPWLISTDDGLSVADPTTLAVTGSVAPPAGGTLDGADYSLGNAGGENTVIFGNADGASGWLRYTGATIARVTLGASPHTVLYAGLPASSLAGGVIEAFGSLWVTNFDAGSVERYAVPAA